MTKIELSCKKGHHITVESADIYLPSIQASIETKSRKETEPMCPICRFMAMGFYPRYVEVSL